MSGASPTYRSKELIEVIGAALVGGGVLTMALFPLAIPIIGLLAVAALPLLILALAAALLAGVVAAPVLLLRILWRMSLRHLGRMRNDGSAPRVSEGLATDGSTHRVRERLANG